jgi:hypothetical protein
VNYLEESFNENKPWDKMATEIITVTGPVDKKGPAVYHLANGPTVDRITDSVTKLFMGIQLQCAQCHNHPFTDYKQTQYWETAAFFLKTRPTGNPKKVAKNGGSISITETAIPAFARKGKGGFFRRLPESGKVLPPRFFQGDQPKLSSSEPYRPVFAKWLASARNPFFSKAMVNRTWGQLFGRGFVSPVDDMHDGNAPAHPELVADLAQQFAAHDFDLKYLIRAICNSEAYQRTSKPFGNNGDAPPELFARMTVKPLTPGQLYDSLVEVMGAPPAGAKGFARKKIARFGPITPRQVFVNFFSVDEGADPLEYQAGIPQVLRLMNAPAFNRPGAVATVLRDTKDWKEATEKLYLKVLSRRPTEAELARVGAHLKTNATDQRQGLADVLWALINCSEFAMNH